jgi:hypothetical protein
VSATSVRSVLRHRQLPPAPRRPGPSWREFLRAKQGVIACDFVTVDTVWLRRLYALFSIELHTRRMHLAGCSPNPSATWATEQARNLVIEVSGRERPLRFLIHDRDAKFSAGFDEVFGTERIEIIRTPLKAPNATAHAERFVRTLGEGCLDRLLSVGRSRLERALREYVDHYNREARTGRSTCGRPSPRRRSFHSPPGTRARFAATTGSARRPARRRHGPRPGPHASTPRSLIARGTANRPSTSRRSRPAGRMSALGWPRNVSAGPTSFSTRRVETPAR